MKGGKGRREWVTEGGRVTSGCVRESERKKIKGVIEGNLKRVREEEERRKKGRD